MHEWFDRIAGSERVVAEMLAVFPGADLYSVVDFLPEAERAPFLGKRARTTFVQHLPWARRHFRRYLPLMPLAIGRLDLSRYDLVISSNHAVAKGVRTGPGQVHVSYVHTPMRYAWDMQDDYLRDAGLVRGPLAWGARWMLGRLRHWDRRTAQAVDAFVANSRYVADRIGRSWGREAAVIYPPVDTAGYALCERKEDFYLAASRLVPYKRMDLIVRAFARMPSRRLIVIGDGPEAGRLRALAAPNVTLLGYQEGAALRDYMQRARALVFAAEEDFGIVPVEAQACGTPVIAFGRGGATESLNGLDAPSPTGVFFGEQTVESLMAAVDAFEGAAGRISAAACRENALRFGAERFRREFGAFVEACLAQHARQAART